jgi:hypothetical protein
MMPPGHVAITWGVARVIQQNNPKLAYLDYRLLGLCALAPDIIDKPLAVLVFTEAHTSQLVAHSLLLSVVIMVAALLWQQRAIPYVLAFSAHLIADRMWNHTESFWWPLFGWNVFWEFKPMNTPQAMVAVYWDIVTRYPQVWVVEILALVVLLWFVVTNRLYLRPNLIAFLRTGRVAVSGTSGEPQNSAPPHPRPTAVESTAFQLPPSD